MSSHTRKQIDSLLEALEEIGEKYTLLLKYEDPTYDKYREEIERSTQERRDSLDSYRQKELDAAKRAYDGAMYQIELDYEHDVLNLEETLTDYIRCKYELIKKALPNAARYFRNYTSCPFIKVMTAEENPDEDNMSIELSKEPLVSDAEFDAAINEARLREKRCVVDGSNLVYEGLVFQPLSRAILINGKSNPINGTIREVQTKYVVFNLDDGRSVQIPIQALILGMCELRKR